MTEFIKKHKFFSWVVGILGTLIIGGLGSGVWEMMLKPMLSFLSNGIINFLVHTSTSFSNEIYQSISMRSLDRFQAKAYSLIVTILGSITLFLWFILFTKGKKLLNEERDERNGIHESVKERVWILKNFKNFYIFMTFYFVLGCIPFFIYTYDGIKTSFISVKVINFEYLLKVNSDVLSENELKRLESNFAQIKNAQDYNEIIDYLKKLAIKNNKHINRNPL
ncbi:hypothetical protein [Acinetobacter courvalinii]|uniref:Uncharacterized protein n=1 Tax=Acinetobacter courvalinii TaxID=280147 RepID=N9RAH4_9GAMM|nr:hypothetical protein [Acinetobacter courvalinii]ENX36122.1 hypothetical protein F888_03450 [Acinetobacter courvalinii]GGH40136.1 hypothetical protein GCM10007354_26440 [Acinetobacter courvalinii]